jgi:hypothetical protein
LNKTGQNSLINNFEPSSFFESFQIWFQDNLTSEFFKGISKFQNSEYKVDQVGSNGGGSQNFSFLALNTAELAAPQISSKKRRQRRQRRVADGFFFALISFLISAYMKYIRESIGFTPKILKI